MSWQFPKQTQNLERQRRKVGFEYEFTGLKLPQIAEVIETTFNGSSRADGPFVKVVETPVGEFEVSLDVAILQSGSYEKLLKSMGIKVPLRDEDILPQLTMDLFATVAPYEVTTPPIPLDEFEKIALLESALRDAGATGTSRSMLYAFGLHLNPEASSTKVEYIVSHLQAFCLLYEWLKEKSRVDITRRITSFIDPFPSEFVSQLLDPAWSPDADEFSKLYLRYNPTRNRPLDLLPLLQFIDEDNFDGVKLKEDLTKPRPTFHYRLPNCRIDEPDWSAKIEWERWLLVEQLANATQSRKSLIADFHHLQSEYLFPRQEWLKRVDAWHENEHQ